MPPAVCIEHRLSTALDSVDTGMCRGICSLSVSPVSIKPHCMVRRLNDISPLKTNSV